MNSKFTDLDLEHKRQLLLSFRIQNHLAYKLCEKKTTRIEKLIVEVTDYLYPQVKELSDSEVSMIVEIVENKFIEFLATRNSVQ